MIKFRTEMVERQVMESIICDKCKKAIKDNYERQEAYSIRFTGGYGSVFGDTDRVACDLCQDCLKELIGDFCRYNDED